MGPKTLLCVSSAAQGHLALGIWVGVPDLLQLPACERHFHAAIHSLITDVQGLGFRVSGLGCIENLKTFEFRVAWVWEAEERKDLTPKRRDFHSSPAPGFKPEALTPALVRAEWKLLQVDDAPGKYAAFSQAMAISEGLLRRDPLGLLI